NLLTLSDASSSVTLSCSAQSVGSLALTISTASSSAARLLAPPISKTAEAVIALAKACQLSADTSPLVGEVASRAERARREGGLHPAESDKHPPPHPSPIRGESGDWSSASVQFRIDVSGIGGRRQRTEPRGNRVVGAPVLEYEALRFAECRVELRIAQCRAAFEAGERA